MSEKTLSIFLFGWVMSMFFFYGVFKLTDTLPKDIDRKWRTEAVAKGYGEWIVIEHATGQTEFKWKENRLCK